MLNHWRKFRRWSYTKAPDFELLHRFTITHTRLLQVHIMISFFGPTTWDIIHIFQLWFVRTVKFLMVSLLPGKNLNLEFLSILGSRFFWILLFNYYCNNFDYSFFLIVFIHSWHKILHKWCSKQRKTKNLRYSLLERHWARAVFTPYGTKPVYLPKKKSTVHQRKYATPLNRQESTSKVGGNKIINSELLQLKTFGACKHPTCPKTG